MTNENQFTLTGPDGSIIATGSMSCADEVAKVLTAAADLEEIRAQKAEIDASAARIIDGVTTLTTDLFNKLEADHRAEATRRADAERQKAKAEAAEEQRRIEAMPDPDRSYFPAGDLHSLPPADIEPEDPTGEVLEDAGPVPLSYGKLPTSYVKGEAEGDLPNELTKDVPPTPGTNPERSGTRKPATPTPVGISW